MKLFDYKFLILLGLTLVVYFIYREILDLKNKVASIETKVNEVEMKGISDKTSKKSIENKKNTIDNDKSEKQFSLQIPLPPPPKLSPIEEKVEIPNLIHNENDDSDSELIISNSGEHLEIYSNDNSKTLSFSIGESSDINSDLLDEIEEDSNNNNIDLNLNLEEKVDEELKKKTLLVKSERDDDEQLSDLEIKSPKKDFTKLKLSELQCIAEENNINIKKEKGKKKNKTELSKELTEYFSNTNNNQSSIQETSN